MDDDFAGILHYRGTVTSDGGNGLSHAEWSKAGNIYDLTKC